MNIHDVVSGFELNQIRHIDVLEADIYQFTHLKTGAQLIWLSRDDENKTFSIAFKTIPTDDTGVFHILEHSCLSGSEKYPLKEPFVDLLKGSLQTFLNAMTFPDKTVYPVSSRNNQDFINLTRIYLDAVFHPLAVKNPNTFYQEGWHYELLDEAETPSIKGVVYNEMQGAYSSPNTVMANEMMLALFPDTSYQYESGGHPNHIPELTWKQFCDNHHKFYSATNARIFLDGRMDIEEMLRIINDEYLAEMDYIKADFEIKYQPAVHSEVKTVEYELAQSQNPDGKTLISYGYVTGDYTTIEENLAFTLIANYLTGSNESPLKKAILDAGLAEDISFSAPEDSIMQSFSSIDVTNTNEECYPQISAIIKEVLEKVVEEGFDKNELEASLNKIEFAAKERDNGWAPKGVIFAIQSLNTWLYGGDPVDGLVIDQYFDSVREKIHQGWFEKLLSDKILNSDHCATIILKPSTTLSDENQAKKQEMLKQVKADMSEQDIAECIQLNKNLIEWQSREETEEDKKCIPQLSLEDVFEKPTKLACEVENAGNITVLKHPVAGSDISYVHLYFDTKDLTLEEISLVSLLSELLSEIGTEQHDLLSLQQQMKYYIGEFNVGQSFYSAAKGKKCKGFCTVSFSALNKYLPQCLQLVQEILLSTPMNDVNGITNIVKQVVFILEQRIINSGHSYGMTRLMAADSVSGVSKEYAAGYTYYAYLKKVETMLEENSEELLASLKAMCSRLFTADRLTFSVTGKCQPELIEQLSTLFPVNTQEIQEAERKPLGPVQEGIVIASPVSYACYGGNIIDSYKPVAGHMLVASKILTFDYLWANIRVLGGAYGTGFAARMNGSATFYSYRDPSANRSLGIYRDSVQYLKDFVASKQNITRYVIGTLGDYDAYQSAKIQAVSADSEYFANISYNEKCLTKAQILATTKKDIERLIPLFEQINSINNIVVVGSKEAIEQCGEDIQTIIEL